MVAEFFGFLLELLAEGSTLFKKGKGEEKKKKRKKEENLEELPSEITCPLCNKEKLTTHYYCPNCETHVVLEPDTIDKIGIITIITCQSCGALHDSSHSNDFCEKCGELLIS